MDWGIWCIWRCLHSGSGIMKVLLNAEHKRISFIQNKKTLDIVQVSEKAKISLDRLYTYVR